MSDKYVHEMIDDIEMIIDEAKAARFSPGKVMVDKEVLLTVISELRKQIPADVERAHKVLNTKDTIIDEARLQAKQIIDQAVEEAAGMIDGDEIVQMARMRGDEIETAAGERADSVIGQAEEEADQIRTGALQYSKEVMEDIQAYMTSFREAQENIYGQLIDTLNSDEESIAKNCQEVADQLANVSAGQPKSRTIENFIPNEGSDNKE